MDTGGLKPFIWGLFKLGKRFTRYVNEILCELDRDVLHIGPFGIRPTAGDDRGSCD